MTESNAQDALVDAFLARANSAQSVDELKKVDDEIVAAIGASLITSKAKIYALGRATDTRKRQLNGLRPGATDVSVNYLLLTCVALVLVMALLLVGILLRSCK